METDDYPGLQQAVVFLPSPGIPTEKGHSYSVIPRYIKKMKTKVLPFFQKKETMIQNLNFFKRNSQPVIIQRESWNQLFHNLKSIASIKTILIKFHPDSFYLLKEDQLINIFHQLTRLKGVENLHIDLVNWHTVSPCLSKGIHTCLNSLYSLQSLNLNFDSCGSIPDTEWNRIFSSLKLHKKLTKLTLNCYCCRAIDDRILSRLAKSLNSLTQLIEIDLTFAQCFLITDLGFAKLCDALKQNTSLTYVKLNFYCCDKIGDASLEALGQTLAQQSELEILILHFGSCKEIGNKGIESLCKGLKNKKWLEKMSLSLPWCKLINDEALQFLSETLIDLPFLIDIELNFLQCPNLSREAMRNFSWGLKSKKDIKKLSLSSNHDKTY